jgi:alpha-galactosidase
MPDLPLGAVVETNAFFSRDSVQPVITKGLPAEIRTLVLHHLTQYQGILEAARERNLEKAYRVFLNDYQIQKLSPQDARELFTSMTTKTLPSLGEDWGGYR